MATKLSNAKYFCDGGDAPSTVLGWESKQTRVVRFELTTGASGATSITIRTQEGTIDFQDGTQMTKIPFYITTSDSSHANAIASGGYAVSGYLTKSGNAWSGTANVLLKENTKYYIWFFPYDQTYGWYFWHSTDTYYATYELTGKSNFTLSVSAGAGSTIKVNRTQSAIGASLAPAGSLTNGAVIYKGDKLQITFTPNANYGIDKHTVNGIPFTSGNTHTVAGDVAVISTAYVLASGVGATDANVESVSTITITKFNTNYYHSLQYSFGNITGYITSTGGVKNTEEKFKGTSVPFLLPTSFYPEIPNSPTGICKITCRTYSSASGSTVLGEPTECTFTVTATGLPTIQSAIEDVDPVTTVLTGDSSTLIRYRSNPKCKVVATPKNHATISSIRIRGDEVDFTVDSSGVATAEKLFIDSSHSSYDVSVTDSRGYTTTKVVRPVIVDYIQLTCSPIISRPTPTGNEIVMSVTGSLYRGSFGAVSNALTLDFRYKESNGTYGSWQSIPQSAILLGASQYTVTRFSLGENFDYKKSYVFQVRVKDGSSNYVLSTVTKTVEIQKGVPIFDWGENDFNVNAELRLENVNIIDIIYPVGSIYMHSSSSMPSVIARIGDWMTVSTGIGGIYAWKRTD